MDTSTSVNIQTPDGVKVTDVAPGSYPFYVNGSASNPMNDPNPDNSKGDTTPTMVSLTSIPQGPGSGLNSDMVDGIHAVTAIIAGPNALVATGVDNRLPFATIPSPLQRVLWQQLNGF